MDGELVALERAPQLGLDVEPLHGVAAAERVEHDDAAGRVALRADERDLGLLEHVAGAGRAGVPTEIAHARADEPGPAVEVERRLQLEVDALREGSRLVGVAGRQQDAEGVAAEPADRCRSGPRTWVIRRPTSVQDAIAGGVAEALVDDLEAVDVEQQDRDRLALGAGRRVAKRLDDPLDQASPASAGP